MAYNNSTPQPGDSISSTQPKILGNFQAIGTWTAVDHVGFNLADAGKHNKVTLVAQSPAPSFTGTELGVYNFVNPATSKNEIYVTKFINDSLTPVPITASTISNSDPSNGANVETYFPSGMLLQSKFTISLTATNALQTHTQNVSGYTKIFNVIFALEEINKSFGGAWGATNYVRTWLVPNSITNAQFKINYVRQGSDDLNFRLRYFVIGY